MKTSSQILDTLRLQLPLKWWFSALTACLGAFAGLLGSIYVDSIKSAFPFVWGSGPIIWPAVLFWTALLIFGLFFGLGFNAQNEATNKLEQVIRTLPPRGFLVAFEDFFKECFAIDWKAHQEQKTLEGLKSSITTALSGVVFLVKTFDTRYDHPSYSVNIMLFKPIDEVSQSDLAELITFAEPGYNPDAWDGVLQLQTEFAFTLKEGGPQADTGVRAIMLPIPKPEYRSDDGKPTILPGAPTVFCDPTKFAGFENTLQLATWCREYSGLRASIAETIERYFVDGPGTEIRSFISVPIILPPTQPDEKPTVLGVLNLHSNREGILPGEKGGLFVPLTTPFMLIIARCLHEYTALSRTT